MRLPPACIRCHGAEWIETDQGHERCTCKRGMWLRLHPEYLAPRQKQFLIPRFKDRPELWAESPGPSLEEKLEEMTMTQQPVLKLETNIWSRIGLKWIDGIRGENANGEYVRFATVRGQTLFTPPAAADLIRQLGVKAREEFEIRKAEVRNGGGRPHIQWEVRRVEPRAGEQSNGTLVVRKEASSCPESGASRMAAEVMQPPSRIPYDVAFREILAFVTVGLAETREQWSDQARQAMVCTIFIQASKDGLLTMWERAS
jgi:hypothetical protein